SLRQRPAAKSMAREDIRRAFVSLAQRIAEFNADLARDPTAAASAERLKLAQEELVLIGDLEEGGGVLGQTLLRLEKAFAGPWGTVVESLAQTWDLAVRAADGLGEGDIAKLRERTSQHDPLFDQVRAQCTMSAGPGDQAKLADVVGLFGTVE